MAMNMKELEEYRMQKQGVQDLSGPIGNGYGDTPQGIMGRTGYENAIMERNAQTEKANGQQPVSGSDMATKGLSSPEAAEAIDQAGKGNKLGTVGSGMMAAGAATANPYLLAAGAAVKVVSSGEENRRANVEKQRLAYNERIAQRQQQLNVIGKIAIK